MDEHLSGLFLATSALSPDGRDHLEEVKAKTPFHIKELCGSALETAVRTALRLPGEPEAERLVAQIIPVRLHHHIVHTDSGTFAAVVGCGADGGFADRFALLRADGR